MGMHMKTSLGKLLEQIENNDLDINAALVTKPENVAHYSGYNGGNAILFIHSLVRYIIILDESSGLTQGEVQCKHFKVIRLNGSEVIDFLTRLFKKLGVHHIWFEEEQLENYDIIENMFKNVHFIPDNGIISKIPSTLSWTVK